MKFNGSVGVCIVVLSLLLAILAGAGLNLDKTTESTIDYNYTTDISGLFNHGNATEYIENNPASNYTGYQKLYTNDSATVSNNNGWSFYLVDLSSTTEAAWNGTCYSADVSLHNEIVNNISSGYFLICSAGMIYTNGTNVIVDFAGAYYTTSQADIYFTGSGVSVISGAHNDHMSISWLAVRCNDNSQYNNYTCYPSNVKNTGYINDISNVYGVFNNSGNSIVSFNGASKKLVKLNDGTIYTIQTTDIVTKSYLSGYTDIYTGTVSQSVSYNNNTYYYGPALYPKSVTGHYQQPSSAGISYTTTDTANNYVMTNKTIVNSGDFSPNSFNISSPHYVNNSPAWSVSYDLPINMGSIYSNPGSSGYYTSIEQVLLGIGSNNYSNARYVLLECYDRPVTDLNWPSTNSINLCYLGGNMSNSIKWTDTVNSDLEIIHTTKTYCIVDTDGTDTAYIYKNGILELYGPATDIRVYWILGSYANIHYTAYNESISYMSINDGVKINNTSSTYYTQWSNTYDNGEIDILFNSNGNNCQNTITTSKGDVINITSNSAGLSVQLNNNTAVNCGAWNTFILKINGEAGTLNVQPCYLFINYTNVTEIGEPIYIGALSVGEISHLNWSNTTTSFRFSVYNTQINLGTTTIIMIDPSIDLTDYWPNEDYLRVRLYSFAAYGSAVEINGTTYNITNGSITIDFKTHAFKNVSITYEDKVYLTFNDENRTYDLGAVSDTELNLTGQWYFTAGLYTGTAGTKEVYSQEWTIDNLLVINDEAILIFVGLIALLSIVGYRLFDFRLMDGFIVSMAAFVALFLMLGQW